jgi:hypothetical protein
MELSRLPVQKTVDLGIKFRNRNFALPSVGSIHVINSIVREKKFCSLQKSLDSSQSRSVPRYGRFCGFWSASTTRHRPLLIGNLGCKPTRLPLRRERLSACGTDEQRTVAFAQRLGVPRSFFLPLEKSR